MEHPAGSGGRFFLLAAAGEAVAAAEEGAALAEGLLREGAVEAAFAVLEEGLAGLKSGRAGAEARESLLEAYCRIVFYTGSVLDVDRLLYHLDRCDSRGRRVLLLDGMARCTRAGKKGQGVRGLEILEGVRPLLSPESEGLWWMIWLGTFRSGDLPEERRRREERRALGEVRGRGASWSRRVARSILGYVRYRRGEYESACRQLLRVAGRAEVPSDRANNLLMAASYVMETRDLARARALVEEAMALTAPLRLPHLAAFGEWMRQTLAYREDGEGVTAPDLVEAALAGESYNSGNILLTAAAAEWRAGGPRAAEWALAAAETYGRTRGRWGPELLARALAVLAGAPAAPGEREDLAARGAAIPVPGVALQVLGLIGWARTGAAAPWLERARACVAALDPGDLGYRREVLSAEEAWRGVEADAAGSHGNPGIRGKGG